MSQMLTPEPPSLSYASPAPLPRGPRVWACFVLMIGALGLVFLGGCFMIGIWGLNQPSGFSPGGPVSKSSGQVILEVVLYVIATGCFSGAVWLLFLAVKWLRRVVFS